jgi:hypothetical protein
MFVIPSTVEYRSWKVQFKASRDKMFVSSYYKKYT